MSQLGLSQRCNTAASYIGEIEIGRKLPSLEMLEKIAAALQIPVHLLLWDEEKLTGRTKIPRTIPDDLKEDLITKLNTLTAKFVRQY